MKRGLLDQLKLRVIAADPPLDWAEVQAPDDFRSMLGKRVDFGVEVTQPWMTANFKQATKPRRLSSLRWVGAGGDVVSPELQKRSETLLGVGPMF